MNIILLGAQASGKGTQAELLTRAFGLPHISSGDLFREEIARHTILGYKMQGYIERGALVPDTLTVAIVLRRLQKPDCQHSALLDGFPRTHAQARALDQGIAARGKQIDAVVSLEVTQAELLRRIAGRFLCQAHQHIYNIHSSPPKVPGICDLDGSKLSQRADDQGEAAQQRLNIFFTQTVRLLDYYGAQGKVIKVNGEQAVEKVHQAIASGLSKLVTGQKTVHALITVGSTN
ncbi:MAG TPA: adenylate kinase [Ktedonobacteraceae bacterium]